MPDKTLIARPLRRPRVPIPVKILTGGTIALLVLTLAIIFSAHALVKAVAYNQIARDVEVGQSTLVYLVGEHGAPGIDGAGDLRFGDWRVRGDHSVVDRVRSLTGVDATIFALRDGRPIRVTTTVRKLNSTERNDNTELLGPARAAFDRGTSFIGVSLVAGQTYINRYEPRKDASGKIVGIL